MGNALQSTGNALFGSANMGDSNVSGGYQPQQLGAADTGYMGAMGQQQTYNQDMSGMAGNAMNLYNQQANNPYASGMQSSMNQLGGQMQGMGQQGMNYGSSAMGQGQNTMNQAGNLYQTGNQLAQSGQGMMQNANPMYQQGNQAMGMANQLYSMGGLANTGLYNQMQQQNTDQTNASLSERGLATSGFGAGIADQSNQNFNNAWQQNQLQNQINAASAAGSMMNQGSNLYGQAANQMNSGASMMGQQGQMYGQGANMGTSGASMMNTGQGMQQNGANMGMQGNALGYETNQGITGNQNQAMQNYYGNMSPLITGQQGMASGYGGYMGIGNQAAQNSTSAQSANQPKGLLGSVGINISDRRLKTNINRIGTHKLGIGIYSFNYVWGKSSVGVMADEVEKVMPSAVIAMANGFKAVDYDQL